MQAGRPVTEAVPAIVVAGYGNPLRGDDGAGWLVANALETRWANRDARVRVLVGQQPVPEWAPVIAEARVVIFVDAAPSASSTPSDSLPADPEDRLARDASEPVALVPLADAERTPAAAMLDAHALGPAGLLALADILFGHAPPAFIVTIPAERFDFAASLSPRTGVAAEAAVRLVDAAICSWLPRDGSPAGPAPRGEPRLTSHGLLPPSSAGPVAPAAPRHLPGVPPCV
jgi:Ni,Fe-hydrogenase maturation factor